MRRSQLSRWARPFIAGTLGLAGLAFALECVARLTTGGAGRIPLEMAGARSLWRYDEQLGWALKAGASTSTRFDAASRPGPDAAIAHINTMGLRGRELASGADRVLLLGDSFAFGLGLDDEHTLAAHLGALAGPKWDVLNGGVSGYSTDQELLLFKRLATLRPAVVVLIVCDNDFEANTSDSAYESYRKPVFQLVERQLVLRNVPVPTLTAWERVKRSLAQRSYGWGWLRSRRTRTGERPFGLAWMEVAIPTRTGQEPLRVTTALVLELHKQVESIGGRLLVVNTGHVGEDRGVIGRLMHRLQLGGVRSLRIDGALDAARHSAPSQPWDFGSDSHWNVAASQLAARLVYADLSSAGWLGQPESL